MMSEQVDTQKKILIVDDEQAICSTLKDILSDEGFLTDTANNGEEALRKISAARPDLVILDVWMPGQDGIETLKILKSQLPDLPVLMISGHATVSTAVKATQMGAADFIEKPLDLETTVKAVHRILANSLTIESRLEVLPTEPSESAKCRIDPIALQNQKLAGNSRPQKTLAFGAVLYGVGVHTGQKSGLILEPLPENSGIHFAGVASKEAVPAHVNYVETTGYATTIKSADSQAGTIEHLMSALHAYGITNLLVKCNGEVPVMDGSALEFCRLIEEIGVVEQSAKVYEIAIDKPYQVGNDKEFIKIEPADKFSISYTLSYPAPVGLQKFTFTLDNPSEYKMQIAPCRTFGFVKDIAWLQKQGLAQGGRFNNFVLIGENGSINTPLRFPDEQVRHKILDAIGDLYLLGRPLRGKITACMTGHSDNIKLLQEIYKSIQ